MSRIALRSAILSVLMGCGGSVDPVASSETADTSGCVALHVQYNAVVTTTDDGAIYCQHPDGGWSVIGSVDQDGGVVPIN